MAAVAAAAAAWAGSAAVADGPLRSNPADGRADIREERAPRERRQKLNTQRLVEQNMNLATLTRTAAILVAILLLASPSYAADVRLSNGSVWKGDVGATVRATYVQNGRELTVEGTVVKAERNLVVIEVEENGRTVRRTIVSFDLRKLETISDAVDASGGGSAKEPSPAAPASQASASKSQSTTGGQTTPARGKGPKKSASPMAEKPRIFVLPMNGTVGTGMRHNEIEAVAKEADKFGDGQIIVLLIESGGGLVIEGDKIHATLKEVKKRHRVIAWIREAISAAAFTALHCDEIYFMRVGAFGSITMFAGTTAISGRELDAWLEKIAEVAKMGNRPPIVAQAMVTNPIECSYDKDEDGNVTWYSTMQGKYKLSDAKENLTLNASNALHSGFSDGTADTVEELAALLQLKDWTEEKAGRRIAENWQRLLKRCIEEKVRLANDLQNPAGSTEEEMLGFQIRTLTEINKWYERCYPGMVYEEPRVFPPSETENEAPEEFKRMLARLKKDLADLKKRERP